MKTKSAVCVIFTLAITAVALAQEVTSSYAGQQDRDIKSLSAEDVDAYLAGKGMGFAKAAELNGYAGPKHVLELASQLDLTSEQRARTESLLASMSAEAASLGQLLVAEERRLDQLFATKTITPELLSKSLTDIGTLQAKVREAHLRAHIAQVDILAPEQSRRYNQLRGYDGSGDHSGHDAAHMHRD